jgi:hypothetical protein
MSGHLTRGTCKYLLDLLQIKKVIGTASRDHSETGGEDIDERSGVAIKAVETEQHRSGGQPKFGCIGGDYLGGSHQFASVISIA